MKRHTQSQLLLMLCLCVCQVSATVWCVCPWPAATSPPVCTHTLTRLETTTWTISLWPLRTSTWRSLSSPALTHMHVHHSAPLISPPPSPFSQIPLLQRAQALSPRPLALLASAWSAPAWMKTNGALTGKGSLKGQPGGKEHKTWAQYYIRCGALPECDVTCW